VNFDIKRICDFSHISKRQGTDVVCYTKPLDSLKGWNDHFFWIDAFACLALFPWHNGKSVLRDVIPKSSEFSLEHYATLVAYLAPFHKNRFVILYPNYRSYKVAPDRSLSELEASVDKIFDKRGNGEQAEQGDSASGGHGVGIDVVAKTIVEDKLRDDYGAPGGPIVGGKYQSLIHRLFFGAVQNAEVRGGIMPTLTFVSFSVSITPEREEGDHIELLAGANLQAIGAPQRFIISSDSSNHSGVNIAEAEVDSVVRTSMPIIRSATTTTPTADPAAISKEKLVGSSVFGADSSSAGERHPIFGGFFDCSCSDFLIGEAEAAKTIRLRAEISKLEVTALNERNTILEKERNALYVKVTDLQAVVVSKDRELIDFAAQLTSIKSHNDNLANQVSSSELKEKLSNNENLTERLEEFQDAQLKVINDKFDKLCADFVEVTFHLEERIAVGKAIEKSMQDGLADGIIHGREELKSNKDASIEAVMNIMRLEEHLAARLGLNESQPHADQLMVPIHHFPDKTVVGASALSLALDVLDARVRRIRENIMIHRSLFQDAYVPLAEPLSAAALIGMEDDYRVMSTDDQSTVNESVVDKDVNPFPNVRRSCFPSQSLSLYAPFPSAFVTSYGPSYLGSSFHVSFAWLASFLRMTASVSYVNENGMSPLLEFIIVRCDLIFPRGHWFADV
nr:hypothetical protein [Tanacetum cinerariifolium]